MNKDTLEHLAIGRRLLAELNEALAALDQGATVDDVTTMTSKRPGVTTRTDGSLIAWDYDIDGEPLVVDEASFDLVSVGEVAQLAGLAPSTVKSHVQRGAIVAPVPVARSRTMVWRRGEIIAWIEMRQRKSE